MIAKLVVYKCRNCDSQNLVRNGHNASGSQQYWCKDCGKRGVLEPKRGYSEAQKEQILSAYNERSSMRGVQRTFGVSRPTLASWLKKDETNPKLEDRLLPACTGSRWNVVICLWKMEQTLALDGYLLPHSPNRGFRYGWSKRGNLPQALGANTTRIQRLPELQRFLGGLSTRLSWRDPPVRWQRQSADESYGTMVSYFETIECTFR